MNEIPSSFYVVIGVVVVTNVGAIASFLFATGKAVWWLSKLESRVDEAKATAVRAHKRIDVLETNQ